VFDQSLTICRAIGDRQGEAEGINDLGLVYISQEDRARARRCWEESAAIFRSLGLEKRTASVLHRLGILDITLGDYANAQHHLEESLAINRADNALPAQALDLGWLGLLCYQRGEYEQAQAFLAAALALDAHMDGSEEAIWHMTWMGEVAYERGDLSAAESYLNAALQQAEERGMDRRQHHIYSGLAEIHLARGEGSAACQAAERAAACIESGANEYALLGVVHSSGLLAQSDDPAIYFEQALALQETNPFLQGIVLRRYGTYLLSVDKAAALRYLQEALAILSQIGARGELAKTARALDAVDDG
jgi:tetratricopeptide (TPR) repeat protein